MDKKLTLILLVLTAGIISTCLGGCSSSGGGGDPDKADIKYTVDTEEGRPECVGKIRYIDETGSERTKNGVDSLPFRKTFSADPGARLFISAKVSCDRAEVRLYINSDRVARDTSTYRAEIDGYLRRDDQGNWSFEN